MSVQVAVKKRGRPKKVEVEDVAVVVEEVAAPMAPTPKTRAKATAKKSASSSTATVSPSATTPSSKRRSKEAVQDAGPADVVETAAPIPTKRKVAAVQSAKSSTSATTSKAKLSPAASVDGKSEAPSRERASSQSRKKAATSESNSVLKAQHSRQAESQILKQANAFSIQSHDLGGNQSELVDQRQTETFIQEASHPEKPQHLAGSIAMSQSSQQTTTSPAASTMPPSFRTTSSIPQVRAYSSTSPLPMSTTIALAARQTAAKLPPRPSGGPAAPAPTEPRHPSPFEPPSEAPGGPRPPKLSEMTLDQRKKDPQYRKAAFRYTALMVAFPFLIVSSYLLWQKYQEHQLYLARVREARGKATVPVAPDQLARPASPTSTPASHETTN